jgi:hypothetical protein
MRMRELRVEKLSDEFVQYTILLRCDCGHERQAYPKTLATISGWDAKLEDVVRRMRCSKCGERKCSATLQRMTAHGGNLL